MNEPNVFRELYTLLSTTNYCFVDLGITTNPPPDVASVGPFLIRNVETGFEKTYRITMMDNDKDVDVVWLNIISDIRTDQIVNDINSFTSLLEGLKKSGKYHREEKKEDECGPREETN